MKENPKIRTVIFYKDYFSHFFQPQHQGVDIVRVVVQIKRSPAGGRHIEAAHEGLGAVVARAGGHAEAVENGADVVRMHPLQHERQDGGLVARCEDADALG